MRKRGSMGRLALGLVASIGMPAFLAAVVGVFALMPSRFNSAQAYRPNSGIIKEVIVHASGKIPRGDDVAESSLVTVTIVLNNGQAYARAHEYGDDEHRFMTEFASEAALLNWLRSLGVDVARPSVRREAAELSTEIQYAAWGSYGPSRSLRSLTIVDQLTQ